MAMVLCYKFEWDRSSAWLERLPVKEEVGGSSPLGPARTTALSQLPGTEEMRDMWKTLVKQFNSTDSIVSLVLGLAVVLVIGMTVVNYVKSKTQQAASTTQEAAGKTAGVPSPPAKHTVVAGESLWTISEIYYKSGYNWVDIRDANTMVNPDLIEAGQTLTIPDVAPKGVAIPAISSASTSEKPKDASYTVVHGDDLWTIAVLEYGNGYKWVDIAAANKLANPSIIHSGNVLVMP
jgi:nucleoid-associated protein YgaU